jgi:thiosulfate/3-mercaptopyruvate sulfurtransferase
MKQNFRTLFACLSAACAIGGSASAQIGIISPADAHALLESTDASKRPLVLDTRGGYKDYFRAHLPTAHHINFDTLRGTAEGVPVQYLPDELTRQLLIRAGVDTGRTHLLYATGDKLPNDEVLSATMVAYVLEKFGVKISGSSMAGCRRTRQNLKRRRNTRRRALVNLRETPTRKSQCPSKK